VKLHEAPLFHPRLTVADSAFRRTGGLVLRPKRMKTELDDWNQHGTKLKLTHGPGLVVEEQHDDVMRYLESLRDTK
jgi:hypothetical protein